MTESEYQGWQDGEDDLQGWTGEESECPPIDIEQFETLVSKCAHSRRAAGFSPDEIREAAESDLADTQDVPDDEYGTLLARGMTIAERVILEPVPNYSLLFVASSRIFHGRSAGQLLEALVAANLRGEPIE